MKLMLAAAAALTTLAGFGTTSAHADTIPAPLTDPTTLVNCLTGDASIGLPKDCTYCVEVDGLPPVFIQAGTDANAFPVPDVFDVNKVCALPTPVGTP